jgi:hypothetical protein
MTNQSVGLMHSPSPLKLRQGKPEASSAFDHRLNGTQTDMQFFQLILIHLARHLGEQVLYPAIAAKRKARARPRPKRH